LHQADPIVGTTRALVPTTAPLDDFARFFGHALDLHGIANREGRFRRVNPAWQRALGWTVDELTGSPWLDFVHPDDLQATTAAGKQLFEGASIVSFENRYRCKDGSYRWLQWHAESVNGEAYCTGRDVTDERLQKDARNQRYVENMAEVLPQIVWTARPDGSIDYYNGRWFDYTGMTLEQTCGWGWQPAVHPDDLQYALDRWAESYQSGNPYELEARFKRASDGAYRWHLCRALPVRDASDRIVKWFGTCTDIDDQKRAQETLREAQQQLEVRVAARTAELARSNEEKTSLLLEVHHRVNNNLQMISSLISLQAQQIQNQEARASLLEIQGRVHAIALLHECLYQSDDFGRIDMHEYLNKLVATMQSTYGEPISCAGIDAAAERIFLALDVAVPCGLIINELVTNALKHAFRGPNAAPLRAIQIAFQRADGDISVSVADNGLGFPSQLGLGSEATMGLTLVRDLSRQLRGHAEFRSEGGAHCTVTFPEPQLKGARS
jgi:PAS domain S-box-containing protein